MSAADWDSEQLTTLTVKQLQEIETRLLERVEEHTNAIIHAGSTALATMDGIPDTSMRRVALRVDTARLEETRLELGMREPA